MFCWFLPSQSQELQTYKNFAPILLLKKINERLPLLNLAFSLLSYFLFLLSKFIFPGLHTINKLRLRLHEYLSASILSPFWPYMALHLPLAQSKPNLQWNLQVAQTLLAMSEKNIISFDWHRHRQQHVLHLDEANRELTANKCHPQKVCEMGVGPAKKGDGPKHLDWSPLLAWRRPTVRMTKAEKETFPCPLHGQETPATQVHGQEERARR